MDAKTLKRLFAETDLPRRLLDAAMRHLGHAAGVGAAFWEALRADPGLSASDIDELRFVIRLGELTDAHLPLVRALLQRRKAGEIRHAADLFDLDWLALVTRRVGGRAIGAPARLPGQSAARRNESYARRLAERLPAVFATGAVVHALRHDTQPPAPEVVRFFADNPDFDLRGAGIDAYLCDHPDALQGIDPAHRREVVARLHALQRLFWLTDRLPEQAATVLRLCAAGLDSAPAIAALGQKSFCTRFAELAHLATVHARATQHTATVLAVNARLNRQYDAVGVAAINRRTPPLSPSAAPAQRAGLYHAAPPTGGEMLEGVAVPDWRQLFGALDDGACDPARSVLSPAAYLVDLISMLDNLTLTALRDPTRKDAKALAILRERRPDIEDIELCQANAETTLPYIDLVLEVLECALFPMHFALADEASAVKAIEALKRGEIDDTLGATFIANDRPLGPDARVEADRDAADTCWHIIDADLRYRLENVFESGNRLRVSVQPPRRRTTATPDELRAAPQYVDVRAYEALRARVYPWSVPFDLWAELARAWLAQLGVPRHRLIDLLGAPDGRQALVASEFFALSPAEKTLLAVRSDAAWTHWGFAQPLDEGGTSWSARLAAVPEFLARSALAPELLDELLGAHAIRQHQPLHVELSGTPATATIKGINEDVLARVHRFLRLQRKTGWSIGEFDKVLLALGNPRAFDDAVLIRAQHIRQLQDDFKRPLDEVLGWFADIGTSPASAGATSMARALGLSTGDFMTLRELAAARSTPADDVASSAARVAFVHTLRRLQASGFSAADLDYLLRRRQSATLKIAPRDEQVARVLASIGASTHDIGDVNRQPGTDDKQQRLDLLRIKLHQLDGDDAPIDALLDAARRSDTCAAEIETALDALLALLPEAGTSASVSAPAADVAERAQAAYRRLHALAVLIVRFRLGACEIGWLLDDLGGSALGTAPAEGRDDRVAQTFARLAAFVELVAVRDEIGSAPVDLLRRIGRAPLADRPALYDALSDALGHPRQDVAQLAASLQPDGMWTAASMERFAACLSALKSLGVPAARALAWTGAELTADDAEAIVQAARARIETARWPEIAVPLRDALREKQRAALVACLVAQHGLSDPHALYQHFLLDVEMGAETLTSRIRLAISSLQLYVQRLLMNLEDWGLREQDAEHCRQQWPSLKNYRVWEANRKVFLYPENWIEPELRKDKTALFRALESELLQGDLTSVAAERAVRNYLDGLEEIGKLEICALTADPEPNAEILHVFGRTRSVPKSYYYRRREKDLWSAWEKLEIGIDSDHLIPVVFDRRVYLFWPEFSEQTLSELKGSDGKKLTIGDGTLQSWECWDTRLAFSECRQGIWSPRKLLDGLLSVDRPPPKIDPTKRPAPLDKEERRPRSPRSRFSFCAEIADTSVLIRCLRSESEAAPHAYADQGGWRVSTDARVELVASAGVLGRIDTPFGAAWQRSATALVPDVGETALRVGEHTLLSTLPRRQIAGATPALSTPRGVRLIVPQQPPCFWDGGILKYPRVFVYQDDDRCMLISERRTPPEVAAPAYTAENLYHPAAGDFIRRLNRDGLSALWQRVEQQARRETVLFRLRNVEARFFADNKVDEIDRLFRKEHAAALAERSLTLPDKAATISPDAQGPGTGWRVAFDSRFSCRVGEDAGGELLVVQDAVQQYGLPDASVLKLPAGEVDFAANAAYAQYNWELFLHVPLLLADRLGRNQRFEEAQNWFHHVFDPINVSAGTASERYWKVRAFESGLKHDAQFVAQVERWRSSPFDPHAVARLRVSAYQKTVVMKYIDNLIAWGDQLFRTDTIESINEATQLYVLAAEILGRRPRHVSVSGATPAAATSVRDLLSEQAANHDVSKAIEDHLISSWTVVAPAPKAGAEPLPSASLRRYFCVPGNDKLLAYWDLIDDRLLKIRHSQNIEGMQRALALFEPPIDPGLLVRAKAAGIDVGSALRDISAPLPHYRFRVMLAKALDFCADVRALGAAFLAALERKDALALEQLRLDQLSFDLQHQIAEKAIEEAQQCVADLEQVKKTREDEKSGIGDKIDLLKVAQAGGGAILPLGKAVWKSGVGDAVSARGEKTDRAKADREKRRSDFADKLATQSVGASSDLIEASNAARASPESKKAALLVSQTTYMSAAASGTLPTMITGAAGMASPVALVMGGGQQMAESSKTWAKVAEVGGLIWDAIMEGKKAYDEYRRQVSEAEDHRKRLEGEIKALDKRIAAAGLRVALARLRKQQIDKAATDAGQIGSFLRGRFTSLELHGWRVAQLSTLYFQTYQLAYDLAKRAEKAMYHELGSYAQDAPAFIRFGYWESLRKGLLAGEQLHFDLRRMEKAYLDKNRRDYEITRTISLRALDGLAGETTVTGPDGKDTPVSVFAHKVSGGELTFSLEEALFDRDYPGHYLRRIRAVRISLAFADGVRPENVSCTLTLLSSRVRVTPLCASGYAAKPADSDARFHYEIGSVQSIATSSGVDDAGLFVVDFDDDRYLPFEGAGAISEWKIELPVHSHPELGKLTDIVLQLGYTARDGGSALRNAAQAANKEAAEAVTPSTKPTARRST